METFGTRVKLARITAGFARQEDLAEATGLSKATISAIERDDRTPSMKAMAKIAAALGLSAGGLIDEVPIPYKVVRIPLRHGTALMRALARRRSEASEARFELVSSLERLEESDIEELLAIVRVKIARHERWARDAARSSKDIEPRGSVGEVPENEEDSAAADESKGVEPGSPIQG